MPRGAAPQGLRLNKSWIPMSALNSNPDRSGTDAGRRHGPVTLASLALLAIVVGVALAATPGLGFSRSVTPGLVARYKATFGADARARIGGWQQFIRSIAAKHMPVNELELLGPVNVFFNR